MRKTRFKEEQIIALLKQVEAGAEIRELCRRHGVTEMTFHRWRKKYGGMEASDARKLKALEDENRRLKKLLAETMLENAAVKDVLTKKW